MIKVPETLGKFSLESLDILAIFTLLIVPSSGDKNWLHTLLHRDMEHKVRVLQVFEEFVCKLT